MPRYSSEILVQGPSLVVLAGRFRIDGVNAPDLVVDGQVNANEITVAYDNGGAPGVYVVTLPKVGGGYPQEMIACTVSRAVADDADADTDELDQPCYVVDSYSPTAGTFSITNVVATGATVTALGAAQDNSEIHFVCWMRNSKKLAQTV